MGEEIKAFGALKIFFTGVGGQGTLLATRLAGEAALEQGLQVTMSEIHGMAQRGGVVESSVAVGNVLSPTIPDGEADVLMAFEPLEAARALPKCHAGSLVIANMVPVLPFTVVTGQATYPELESLTELVQQKVRKSVWLDAVAIARAAGTERAANIVMVGVLAGMNRLPISGKSWQTALERTIPAKVLDVNRKAFDLGFREGSLA